MSDKEFLSAIAIAIAMTFAGYVPYICSILKGKTKPHVFSWMTWGATTIVVFFAQLSDKGGAGTWPIGLSGLITLYVVILAYIKKSDTTITRIDWLFFLLAMTSLPCWYLTSNPLGAVVILTVVDLMGFGPTFRKAYSHPQEERLTFFAIMGMRNVIAIMALEHYSLTTVLFPAATGAGCLLLLSIILFRRRTLTLAPGVSLSEQP